MLRMRLPMLRMRLPMLPYETLYVTLYVNPYAPYETPRSM